MSSENESIFNLLLVIKTRIPLRNIPLKLHQRTLSEIIYYNSAHQLLFVIGNQ